MNKTYHKLALNADNLLLLLDNVQQSLPAVLNIIYKFNAISGYKLNLNKSFQLPRSPVITYNWVRFFLAFLNECILRNFQDLKWTFNFPNSSLFVYLQPQTATCTCRVPSTQPLSFLHLLHLMTVVNSKIGFVSCLYKEIQDKLHRPVVSVAIWNVDLKSPHVFKNQYTCI